ncbi:unnamed protein product, partial [Ectocarpus sp. 13 AM-2016]
SFWRSRSTKCLSDWLLQVADSCFLAQFVSIGCEGGRDRGYNKQMKRSSAQTIGPSPYNNNNHSPPSGTLPLVHTSPVSTNANRPRRNPSALVSFRHATHRNAPFSQQPSI